MGFIRCNKGYFCGAFCFKKTFNALSISENGGDSPESRRDACGRGHHSFEQLFTAEDIADIRQFRSYQISPCPYDMTTYTLCAVVVKKQVATLFSVSALQSFAIKIQRVILILGVFISR